MLSKTTIKNRVLDRIVSHKSIKSILEIGAGNKSTFLIRKTLADKKRGYCLSLEADPEYYEVLTSKMATGKHGRIEFSPLVYDGKIIKYSYKFSDEDKFDFVYIDGPGPTTVTDTRTGEKVNEEKIINNILSNKKIWVDPTCPRGGRISLFMMDYLLPEIGKDTIILVDGRKMSIMYFYQKYNNLYNFNYVGDPITENFFKMMVKEKYHKKVNFRPHLLTIITNKESKKAKRILKELSLRDIDK